MFFSGRSDVVNHMAVLQRETLTVLEKDKTGIWRTVTEATEQDK